MDEFGSTNMFYYPSASDGLNVDLVMRHGKYSTNKKKTLFKTENAYKLILFFETEAWGNSQMATKKICFPIN